MKTITGNVLFEKLKFNVADNLPIIIIDNPRTPENIGAIMRLAGNLGISELYIVGNESDLRLTKIKKAASTAAKQVALKYIDMNQLKAIKSNGYELIAIETCDTSSNIYDTVFPEKIAFIFGNETNGISKEVLSICSHSLYIPLSGKVKSMNVSHAAAVALFEWFRRNVRKVEL